MQSIVYDCTCDIATLLASCFKLFNIKLLNIISPIVVLNI